MGEQVHVKAILPILFFQQEIRDMSRLNWKSILMAVMAAAFCASGNAVFSAGYIGAGGGVTSVDVCGDIPNAFHCDDKDTGLKIFGGYKANDHFAIEGFWADLGEVSASGPGGSGSLGVDGFGIAAMGILPLNDRFGIFAKLGMFMWDGSGGGDFSGIEDDGTDVMFGAGVRWNFTERFGLRAEWERFDIDGDDVDFLSVGLQFNF